MTCHDVRELFSALIDEALDAGERAAVETHLATCAECRRELERFRSTVTLLRAVEPARAPAGFVDRVLAAARPTPWYRRVLSALFLPWPVKIPAEAAAIVLVAVGVVYVYRVTPELQRWDRIESMQAPTELRGQRGPTPPQGAAPEPPRPEQSRSKAPRPATPEAPPASPPVRTREYMEKDALKDDSSRDAERQAPRADVQAPRALSRAEGKLEATPGDAGARGQAYAPDIAQPKAAPAPEARADAQASAKRQAGGSSNVASFVPPDVAGRLAVIDRDAALRALDELLARLGAVVDRRYVGSEGPILEISVTREAYPELVRGLARLGRWQPTREPTEIPAQIRVVLRITG